MSQSTFLPLVRELVRCYQAFERLSATHIRGLGLTPAQFDIVATLGNTPGLTFKEIGEKTLITKGTLTGVVDRLEERGVVERFDCPNDGRATIVRLTRRGEKLFAEVFAPHLAYLSAAFDAVPDADRRQLVERLGTLRRAFDAAHAAGKKAN